MKETFGVNVTDGVTLEFKTKNLKKQFTHSISLHRIKKYYITTRKIKHSNNKPSQTLHSEGTSPPSLYGGRVTAFTPNPLLAKTFQRRHLLVPAYLFLSA